MKLANGLFAFIAIFLLLTILFCPYPDSSNYSFFLLGMLAIWHTIWYVTTIPEKTFIPRFFQAFLLFGALTFVLIPLGSYWGQLAASLTAGSPLVVATNFLAICDVAYCVRTIKRSLPSSLFIAGRKPAVAQPSRPIGIDSDEKLC